MARIKESAQGGQAATQPRRRAASREQSAPEAPPPDTASPATSRRTAGEPLFAVADVPNEIKALAQHRFGTDIRMGTPRENGGPYKGEVFNTESYLIQEVATRSVVFHAKDKITFVSERLKWCDTNQRLNGADLQIGYEGDRSQAYPWDRARDQLARAVASLKKSAKELGMGDEVGRTLHTLQAKSWSRVKEARSAALAQSKERQAGERSGGSPDSPDR